LPYIRFWKRSIGSTSSTTAPRSISSRAQQGHDSFLVDIARFGAAISGFLAKL